MSWKISSIDAACKTRRTGLGMPIGLNFAYQAEEMRHGL